MRIRAHTAREREREGGEGINAPQLEKEREEDKLTTLEKISSYLIRYACISVIKR